MGISPKVLTATLRRLEDRGLLTREASPRCRCASSTP
ncbi:MarR family transcriptional regulator [Microbacterium sp. NPDC090225]